MNEQSFAFGDNGGLVGTVCFPPVWQPASAKVGVVLFNAGVVHRIGPHRINVRLARWLAANGIPSIRFDLAGQGDSARSDGIFGFEEQAVEDIRAAMDFLGLKAKISRFVLFGFCSGGVHSYATAKVDERVAGLLLYDTYIYPTLRSRINRYIVKIRARGMIVSITNWLNRQLIVRISKLPAVFNSDPASAVAPQTGLFVTPGKSEFAKTLTHLNRNGMRIGMIYSGGFEQYNYRNQFADAFKEFGINDYVRSEYLPEMNHTATLTEQQAVLMQIIVRWCVELNESLNAASGDTLSMAK